MLQDVYKRQVKSFVFEIVGKSARMFRHTVTDHSAVVIVDDTVTIQAVSYTHLDVYKRQVVGIPKKLSSYSKSASLLLLAVLYIPRIRMCA